LLAFNVQLSMMLFDNLARNRQPNTDAAKQIVAAFF
jgi:hypothetical protein